MRWKKPNVVYRPICFTRTEEPPCRICSPCLGPEGGVVEIPPDVDAIERTKYFQRHHVLHGALSPLGMALAWNCASLNFNGLNAMASMK